MASQSSGTSTKTRALKFSSVLWKRFSNKSAVNQHLWFTNCVGKTANLDQPDWANSLIRSGFHTPYVNSGKNWRRWQHFSEPKTSCQSKLLTRRDSGKLSKLELMFCLFQYSMTAENWHFETLCPHRKLYARLPYFDTYKTESTGDMTLRTHCSKVSDTSRIIHYCGISCFWCCGSVGPWCYVCL